MYVGNGSDFHNFIAKEVLDDIVKVYNHIPIPYENMYFMSIEEFDLLMGGIASGEIDLIRLLESAVMSDMKPQTKKLEFEQHIFDKYPTTKFASWLVSECETIYKFCKIRFGIIDKLDSSSGK